VIRLAQDYDLEDVLAIESECFPSDSWRVADAWDRWTWWVFEQNNDVKAFAAASIIEGSATMFLALVGVTAHARGQGLQRRLIRVREAWGVRQCCTHAITYTAPGNVASSNNLIKCGYTLYTPQADWGVPFALYWRRQLVA
jgi:GNAT superfamily N-acetyltransferase